MKLRVHLGNASSLSEWSMGHLAKLYSALLRAVTRGASHSPEADDKEMQHYVEFLQRKLDELPPESNAERRIELIERTWDAMIVFQAKQLAAFETATLNVRVKQLERQPLLGLWHKLKAGAFGFLGRYWLLFSRPRLYFDVHIKDAKTSDLWHTLLHSFYAASALAAIISLFLLFYTSGNERVLALLVSLADRHALYALMILGIIPSFLISCIIYRIIGSRIPDLFFIYANVITLSLLLSICFLLFLPAFYFLSLLVPYAQHATNSYLLWWVTVGLFFWRRACFWVFIIYDVGGMLLRTG